MCRLVTSKKWVSFSRKREEEIVGRGHLEGQLRNAYFRGVHLQPSNSDDKLSQFVEDSEIQLSIFFTDVVHLPPYQMLDRTGSI